MHNLSENEKEILSLLKTRKIDCSNTLAKYMNINETYVIKDLYSINQRYPGLFQLSRVNAYGDNILGLALEKEAIQKIDSILDGSGL